ncbi:MAG: phosphonate C-P lyase system protein PhnH [Rhodomicrobium sp.]
MIEVPAVFQPRNQQRVFRLLLDAMARPGTEADLSPWTGGKPAYLAILASLCDGATTLADPDGLLSAEDLRFLACPQTDAASAAFIAVRGDAGPGPRFQPPLGTLTAPELGATILLCIETLAAQGGDGLQAILSGPGMEAEKRCELGTLHPAWMERRAGWVSFFPLGADFIICDQSRAVALPRTTRAVIAGGRA